MTKHSSSILSIIIVNYNTGDILKECVDSLYAFENNNNFELIIVDNNSPDNSRQIIEHLMSHHKNIRHIFLEERVSFSAANNIGFEASSGDLILIMNPDIIFTSPVFEKLEKLMDTNEAGACSPLLIGTDGEFQRIYFQRYPTILQFIFFYSILSKIFMRSKYLINKYQYNCDIDTESGQLQFTEQLPCAFYFTTRDLFVEAGKMDPSYRLFFEDVDLSYRTGKLKPLAVDTSVRVTHLGGSSFKREDDYWLYGRFITGMLTFFRKHYSEIRYRALKIISRINSYIVLSFEVLLGVFGKSSNYRKRKHRYFIQQLKDLP
ncbi:MAG: glycosyltransferase [Ignavibacteria bacterium]|nr:glycosyltransferase [Ignavibacteria bacterium]MBK9226049.1 glycosyltransferase [Ignavibacteria bacterium]